MGYEAHPAIQTPPDNQVIWRFMDFAKLLSILHTGCLRFTRADRLDDRLEGELTDVELLHLEELRGRSGNGSGAERFASSIAQTRRQCFVNCWYQGDDESGAMWKLYAPGSGGVAVRSSIGAVKRAIKSDLRINRLSAYHSAT